MAVSSVLERDHGFASAKSEFTLDSEQLSVIDERGGDIRLVNGDELGSELVQGFAERVLYIFLVAESECLARYFDDDLTIGVLD